MAIIYLIFYLLFIQLCVNNLNLFVAVPVIIATPCFLFSESANNIFHSLLDFGRSVNSIFLQILLIFIGLLCWILLLYFYDDKITEDTLKIIVGFTLQITLCCIPLLFMHFFVLAPVIAFVLYIIVFILLINKYTNKIINKNQSE